jgi:hypothetical protein
VRSQEKGAKIVWANIWKNVISFEKKKKTF